jgi:hypothetical protein
MDRVGFERYVAAFNRRDYEAVLSHYAERFELHFAGYIFRTAHEVREFYRFFHAHVREDISVGRIVSDDDTVAVEVVIELTGLCDLTAEALAAQGLERLIPLSAGAVVRLPQFIHYHLKGSKIVKALCVLAAEPEFVPA